MKDEMKLYKLVVLGDGGVGKTSLTIQLCLNHFIETYDPTIEDSYQKQVVIDGQACMLEILDTAGQEEYAVLSEQWIRDGMGFILVYSVTSRSSLYRSRTFYNQVLRVKESIHTVSDTIPPHDQAQTYGSPTRCDAPPIMLVGNKNDKHHEREISSQEGEALAEVLGCEFVETSAKDFVNVEEAFYNVVRMLRKRECNSSRMIHQKTFAEIKSDFELHESGPSKKDEKKKHRCVIL